MSKYLALHAPHAPEGEAPIFHTLATATRDDLVFLAYLLAYSTEQTRQDGEHDKYQEDCRRAENHVRHVIVVLPGTKWTVAPAKRRCLDDVPDGDDKEVDDADATETDEPFFASALWSNLSLEQLRHHNARATAADAASANILTAITEF